MAWAGLRDNGPECGCCGACILFEDTFNRADSGTVGNGWTELIDAGVDIAGNRLALTATGVVVRRALSTAAGGGSITFTGTLGNNLLFLNLTELTTTSQAFYVSFAPGTDGDGDFIDVSIEQDPDGDGIFAVLQSARIRGAGATDEVTIRVCWVDSLGLILVSYDWFSLPTRAITTVDLSDMAFVSFSLVGSDDTFINNYREQDIQDNDSTCDKCRLVIGFDEDAWAYADCWPDADILINLADDISRIFECDVVFAGNNAECGDAIRFDPDDWETIQEYIEGGGRLFISAEHSGCLADAANLGIFLTAVGSSMAYVGPDYNSTGPGCSGTYYSSGTANIAAGIGFPGDRFGEISGGTSVWLGPAGTTVSGLNKVAVAVEQLGLGFLFLSGDSDHGACGTPCNFLARLVSYSNDDVI